MLVNPECTWAVRGLAVGGFLACFLAISPSVGRGRLAAAPGASFLSQTSTGQWAWAPRTPGWQAPIDRAVLQGAIPSTMVTDAARGKQQCWAQLSWTIKCGKNWKHIIVHYSNMSSNLPEFPAYHVLQSWTRVSPDWCSVPSEMLYRSRDEIGVTETLCKDVRNSLSARHGHSWSTNVHKKDIVRINYLFLCCMFWRSLFKRNLHHPE